MPTFGAKKQVRFAYKNTFYSPRTPAMSLPSSPGLITPTSIAQSLPGPTPYSMPRVAPLPVKQSHYVRPHPLLETSAIGWNLMEHSSTITRKNHPLSRQALHEPATTPPLPFLSVVSIHLPWIIEVHASNTSFVTLRDVFDSIYRSLRTNITTTEFNSFPHQNDQKRATRAYEQRYRRLRSTSSQVEEKRSGMKRIDFLMGHTKFLGISNSGRRSDEWRLNIT